MAFVMTNEGVESQALVKLGKNTFTQWYIGLFSNNRDPLVTDSWALNPWSGFAPTIDEEPVDYTSWNGTATGGVWTGVCNPLVFTLSASNAGQVIYGYYIRNTDASPILLGAELYSSPYTIPGGGGLWSVAPQDVFQG